MSVETAGRTRIQSSEARHVRRSLTTKHRIIITGVNLGLFLAAWELIASYAGVSSLFLPKLTSVLAQFPLMHEEGILLSNLWISTRNYLVGMLISIVVSIPLGLVIGVSRTLQRAFGPYLWVMYTVPRVVLLPLIVLWAGVDTLARVLLVVVSAGPVILLVLVEGMKTVDPSSIRAAKAFGATRSQLFLHVVVPSSIPAIGTGVRMGVSRGLIGLFVGELFTAANGVGYIMQLSSRTFNSPRLYAMVLVFIIFSVAVVAVSRIVERRISRWRVAAVV